MENTSPIKLTSSNYWKEIGQLVNDAILPMELGGLLRKLISLRNKKVIPPLAETRTIKLARDFMTGGIDLDDGQYFYDVVVYLPSDPNDKTKRRFFVLIPKWPYGKLTHLEDINPALL